MLNPADAVVFAVGIERYGFGDELPGASAEAVRFVEWALSRGVPPDRVTLACDSLERAGPKGVRLVGTSRHEIEKALVGLSRLQGELLLFFWGGHGILDEEHRRVLFTSDPLRRLKSGVYICDRDHPVASAGVAVIVAVTDAAHPAPETLLDPLDSCFDADLTREDTRKMICPVCGSVINPDGPGVGCHPVDANDDDGEWHGYWIPFIYDLRGSPRRLIHPECYARERDVAALVALFHERDESRRAQGCHHY